VSVRACSHALVVSADVPRAARFLSEGLELVPAYENDQFVEWVLPSGFRLALFAATGAASKYFDAAGVRGASALGLTVSDVDAVHARLVGLAGELALTLSGPPKEHPWGEKSFLVIDGDGNRWEIAQSPSGDGMLVPRP
jgi:hypothetical protein